MYVFHELFYITSIEKLSFNLSHVIILGSMECGKTRNYCYHNAPKNNIMLKKYYAEKFSETTSIEIQIQLWGGNRQLSMEGIAVEYFTKSIDPGRNEENLNSIHI